MANTCTAGELHFDFYKVRQILYFRRKQILIIYIFTLLASLIYSICAPKVYESKASILININTNTNINEFNPYQADKEMLYATNAKSSTTKLINNEIQILKSSKVLFPVIEKNKILAKDNQYISTDQLIKSKKLAIENIKNSDVILIKYQDQSPEKAQAFLNDLLVSYTLVSNNLYLEKTKKDLLFLEKYITKTQHSIAKKISHLKLSNMHTRLKPSASLDLIGSIDSNYNLYKQDLTRKFLNYKIYQKELEQEFSNLAALNSKFNKSKILKDYSKNSKKFTVLSGPTLHGKNNYIQPNLILNIVSALAIALFISLSYIIGSEIASKKLPLSDFNSFETIAKINDFYKISNQLILNQENLHNTSIIALVDTVTKAKMLNKLNLILNEKANTSTSKEQLNNSVIESNNLKEILEYIKSSSHIIFLIKINASNRELYKILKQHINALEKHVILELIN